MDRDEVDELIGSLLTGRLGRRAFMMRLLAAGATATTVGAVLAACTGDPPPEPAPTDDLPEPEGELSIYNWSDYIDTEILSAFEAETGCKVTYATYESNEALFEALAAGTDAYDLVVPSGYLIPRLAQGSLLARLSTKYLTNRGNVAPIFNKPEFDKNDTYSIPWLWGTTGIAYRKDKVVPAPDSWGIFLDPKYAGKTTMMDDGRDLIGAWLLYHKRDISSIDAEELAMAKEDALAAKALMQGFVSAPVKAKLISGDVWIAQLWNGDAAQATRDQPEVAYVLPKEGGSLWTDTLVIPKTARHKRAAHEFMNFVLRPEIAAKISDKTGYGTPVAPAMELVKTRVEYPTGAEMMRLRYHRDLGTAAAVWDTLWAEIKAA